MAECAYTHTTFVLLKAFAHLPKTKMLSHDAFTFFFEIVSKHKRCHEREKQRKYLCLVWRIIIMSNFLFSADELVKSLFDIFSNNVK